MRSLALDGDVAEQQRTLAESQANRRLSARCAQQVAHRFLGEGPDRAREQPTVTARRRRERRGTEVVVGEGKLEGQLTVAFFFWHAES